MNRWILMLLMQTAVLTSAFAQPYYFNHYQAEDGLSNNSVVCSLQDDKGFLWFGTKDGLNRFDGYLFKVFRDDPSDTASIGGNFIHSLEQGENGIIWVGSDRGLFSYDPTTERFKRITSIPDGEIQDIQCDGNGDIWVISRLILYRYNVSTGKCRQYGEPGIFEAACICIADGKVWVGTTSGSLKRYEPVTDTFTEYPISAKSDLTNWIQKIYDTGTGRLLVGTTKNGAKMFDLRSFTYTDVPVYNADRSDIFVRDFVRSSATDFWIATETGIFIYNIEKKTFTSLQKNYNDPYSISDNAVYTFCRDSEGGIWAGTYFGGLNYYSKQYTGFKKYFPQYGVNSLNGNAVRELKGNDRGDLWIGTEDAGLNKLDAGTGQFTHFTAGKTKHDISYMNIHGLLLDGNDLWIGTFQHGLDLMNARTGKVLRHYSTTSHSLKSNFIYCLYKTHAGKILAGTDRGIYFYDRAADDFIYMKEFPPEFFTAIYEDRNGTIWAGAYSQGLYYFNPGTTRTGSVKYKIGDAGGLAGNRVNWIMEDSRYNLWIATEGGLCKKKSDTDEFTRYTIKNGFPSNMIFAVLEDKKNNFWISTSKGLLHFSPASGLLKTYTRANGLLSDQFNYNSAYKDTSGRMYFGTVKGLISFHPDEFSTNTFIPPVYITGFQVYDKELSVKEAGSPLSKSVTYASEIRLDHNQSSFSIDFAALSYTAPKMTEYAYKMEGLDKDWTYLKTNRKVYFTELPPGKYTFSVKASNSSGVWSSQPAMLNISIAPPFWGSDAAYFFYSIIALAIIYFIVSGYHKRVEEKNARKMELLQHEKEKEVYNAKIEFFTNVAHEIRTPLTLIKGPMEKLMKQAAELPGAKNNLLLMERNTNQLLHLTSQLLDFRKTEMNGYSLNFIKADVCRLIHDLYLHFRPAAEQKNLKVHIHLPKHFYAYIDVEAMQKILSNLFNNAIKYGESKVSISLRQEDNNKFTVEIRNDGYLIPYEMREKIFETFYRIKETEKQTGTGIGLSLARSLAQLHNGVLELRMPENGANVFALVLPVDQEINSMMDA